MMLTIKCPRCAKEGRLSLVEPDYQGPYKCWSCRELFTIRIHDDVLESMEPLSQEDYEKQHARQRGLDALRARLMRGGC
jgi:hypothetical protein